MKSDKASLIRKLYGYLGWLDIREAMYVIFNEVLEDRRLPEGVRYFIDQRRNVKLWSRETGWANRRGRIPHGSRWSSLREDMRIRRV
jgi:hypothetical protein